MARSPWRVYFWILVVLWCGVAFCQLMWKGLAVHAGNYVRGHWGMRYTEEIIGAEFLLLMGVGLVIYFGDYWTHSRAFVAGIIGCLLLLGLQIATFMNDTGYIYRHQFAGKQYEIPWRYHPSSSTVYNTLGVWVAYPGFTPFADGRRSDQVKLWFQKSPEGSRDRQSSVFEEPREIGTDECSKQGNWTNCRFYHQGFWYAYEYPEASVGDVNVSLQEARDRMPLLLDSFVKN